MPRPDRLVVKIGSSTLVEGGAVRTAWLTTLAADVAAERADGRHVVVVSSGAIALGAQRLGLVKGGRATLEDAQAAAAVGQVALAAAWAAALAGQGLTAAQMLLTLGDLEDRRRYLNARATLERLLALGVVPVINENDSVATQEIRFGDNDRLAARLAVAASASELVLLSDVDGLYARDPALDPAAEPIGRVDDLAAVAGLATDGSASGVGTGGMAAKLLAARMATTGGVGVRIALGAVDHPLARALGGAGTWFEPVGERLARRGWLLGKAEFAGRLRVDAGAARAMRSGASLLAAGIVGVEGDFARGDAVSIVSDGAEVARGLIEYDAADVRRIAGAPREALAERLGAPPRSAVVHRDQLVLT